MLLGMANNIIKLQSAIQSNTSFEQNLSNQNLYICLIYVLYMFNKAVYLFILMPSDLLVGEMKTNRPLLVGKQHLS